ncbi:DNA methyltransferase [Lysobacter korlensis]|uniref:Methyltransferase n=1 Tax=Lysobacter korlensis TaxID=553636 RepID=A0ABV6S021_9GAMM
MNNASWLIPDADPPEWSLPADIRARDALGGRDCGWVNQMRPFIRHFSSPGHRVLDPFCGFGTTLLGAHLEGRHGLGFEIDPDRAALARERLQRHGLHADIRVGSINGLDAGRANLCLTNVPYFGCGWTGATVDGQLYLQPTYADFLSGIRGVFHAVRQTLEDGGFCIAMAQNLVVAGRRFPLAWDVARILDSLFVAHEERVLCYPAAALPANPGSTKTNRSHEYALVYQKRRETVDLKGTAEVLEALRLSGFSYELFGSFQQWQEQGQPIAARLPADADLLLPLEQDQLNALLRWLSARGFQLTLWGEPIAPSLPLETWQSHHYVRADCRGRDGSLIRLDLCCEPKSTSARG